MTDKEEQELAKVLSIGRIEDAWGAYYQVGTSHGPYNAKYLAGIIQEKCKDLMLNQQCGIYEMKRNKPQEVNK